MKKEKLPYLKWSDEKVMIETRKRLKEIKETLLEIEETFKTLGG